MSLEPRVLLVSISAPPKSDPESIQVGRYIKYLVKNGCKIELLSSKNPTLYMETDPHLQKYLHGVSKSYTVKLLENRYLNFALRKFFPTLLQLPDPKWSFRFGKISHIKKPEIIYSRSYPISSTLMGLKLKKKWNVPWILHLSDPWALSYQGNSPATNFKARPRKWNEQKEKECFKLADKISFTSQRTLDLYKDQYPEHKSKFFLSYNVFDNEDQSNEAVSFKNNLNIVYTGGFGEKRSPEFYLSSIEEFLTKNEKIRDKVKFIFTGPMTRENTIRFEKYKSLKEVEHLGVIPYDTMIDLQRQAHILVNIDTDIADPKHSVFFPSKLLEYMVAKRRILALTNKHSTTAEVVSETGGDNVEFNDKKSLIDYFTTYVRKFDEGDSEYFNPESPSTKYNANKNALKLMEEIKELRN